MALTPPNLQRSSCQDGESEMRETFLEPTVAVRRELIAGNGMG